MSRAGATLMLAFGVLLSSGCAHDKLLRLETGEYAAGAKASQVQGRAFYDDLIKNDRELWIALNQFDPECKPQSMRPSFFRADLSGKRLCADEPERPKQLPAFDLMRSDFAAEYAALSFIANYLDALSKAAADPELGAKEDFVAAAGDLNTLLAAFRQKKIPDNQIGAIGDLLGFAQEMAKEHRSAKEVRVIVAERRERTDQAFREMILALKRDKSHQRALESAKSALASVVDMAPDGSLSTGARKRVIELHYAQMDAEHRRIECAGAADPAVIAGIGMSERDLCGFPEAGAMLAAWRSHRAFLDMIDGRLSAKQKSRLVKLQRENFTRMVKLYLDMSGIF